MSSSAAPVPDQTSDLQVDKVLFLSLLPLAHLALTRATPLRDLKRLLEIAYFREAKRRGLTYRQVAEHMAISEPKTALLARQLKAFFTEAESSEPLSRQVLALLRSGPLSESRIAQFLSDVDPEELKAALRSLCDRGLIESVQTDRSVVRYQLCTGEFRQGHDEWSKKLDGLSTFLRSVARLVEARFFEEDDRAAARRLEFRIRPEHVDRLRDFYETQLLPLVRDLDEAATDASDAMPIELGLHWVPGRHDD